MTSLDRTFGTSLPLVVILGFGYVAVRAVHNQREVDKLRPPSLHQRRRRMYVFSAFPLVVTLPALLVTRDWSLLVLPCICAAGFALLASTLGPK